MKRINIYSLLTLIFGCLPVTSFAQQEFQFSNSAFNPYLLNPAAGGLTDVMQFEVASRVQWMGYDGGPSTFMASGHSQIKFFGSGNDKVLSEFNIKDEKLFAGPKVSTSKTKHIIGGKVWNDAIGPFGKTSVQGSYAYHLPLTKSLNFGAGIGLGYSNFRINEARVTLYQQDDNTYNQFLGNTAQQNFMDAQAGLVVYGERLFLGISGTQLLKNELTLNQITTGSHHNRHAFIIARYRIAIDEDADIEPMMVIKTTLNSPASLDFGARYLYKNSSWIGLQYRTGNTLVFMAGTNLVKNLYVNYCYDQAVGKIRSTGSGTHELQLGYYLGRNRNVDKELKENSEK
jgi:type IX secretion system PorP/SprF family membrane protein